MPKNPFNVLDVDELDNMSSRMGVGLREKYMLILVNKFVCSYLILTLLECITVEIKSREMMILFEMTRGLHGKPVEDDFLTLVKLHRWGKRPMKSGV